MDWEQIEGKWKQSALAVKEKWNKLTDDDLRLIGGKMEQLVGKIQERYGIARDDAQKQVDEFTNTYRRSRVNYERGTRERTGDVEMKIRGLMMDPVTNMPIVVLKDVQGQAILPIWVGVYEANAIALEIEKVQTPRPMTHDLLKNVLLGLD